MEGFLKLFHIYVTLFTVAASRSEW